MGGPSGREHGSIVAERLELERVAARVEQEHRRLLPDLTAKANVRFDHELGAEGLQARAPEVSWVLPARLRQIARRNPGMITEPDHMGQSILRSPKLKRVPDPLRTSLRNLTSFTGGRYAMVPAALAFARDSSGGLRADLSIALADSRTGQVAWHALTWGIGESPDEALTAAVAAVLPLSAGP